MTDHAQVMVDKLLAQFGSSPNLEALARALGERLNVLERVIADLQEKRWIDTAEAVQLDGCGVIVDQARLIDKAVALPFFGFREQTSARGFGKARFRKEAESYLSSARLGDNTYRKVIKLKVAKNISTGTTEETITSYQNLFNAEKVILSEKGNAKIQVDIGKSLTEEDVLMVNALGLYIKPGGVGVEMRTYFNPRNTFGFRNQKFQGFKGAFAKRFKEVEA